MSVSRISKQHRQAKYPAGACFFILGALGSVPRSDQMSLAKQKQKKLPSKNKKTSSSNLHKNTFFKRPTNNHKTPFN
jgi:hypothetical protein